MDEKRILYADSEKLIRKLDSQGLIMADREAVKLALDTYGYSNLIKSYRDPFIFTTQEGKKYRNNASYEQIFSLYVFDKMLRNAVMSSMLDLEEYIKMTIAEIIAKDFGTDPENYLAFKNYRNRNKKVERFRLSNLLRSMRECLKITVPPISHYQTKYGCVPPWILFKSIYFSTMVNFIDCFKKEQLDQLIAKLYPDLPADQINLKMLLLDTLFMCNEYRNVAAHGGRIYNYKPKSKIRYVEIFNDDRMYISDGISSLLYSLDRISYDKPFVILKTTLDAEINRHCTAFPQDNIYIGEAMSIDIIATDT